MVVVDSVLLLALVFVAAIRPSTSGISKFELERRSKSSEKAKRDLMRHEQLPTILALRKILEALLLVVFILLSVATFGWLIGVTVGVLVAIFYGALAGNSFVSGFSNWAFSKFEQNLIDFADRFNGPLRFLRTSEVDRDLRIGSRDELKKLISESSEALGENQQRILSNTVDFDTKRVGDIMTPRGMIRSIKSTEFIGPLVLSELHDQGHSRLPVIKQDIDHVVGILYLDDMLTLKSKDSETAEKLMDRKVFYIHEDQTLDLALSAFIKSRHHMFIVINGLRETVGLLTLEDVIESLIGQKIVDENDHTNIDSVARSIAKSNNSPRNHQDV